VRLRLAGFVVAVRIAVLAGPVGAQLSPPRAATADSYEQRFAEVMALAPVPEQVAAVDHLVLQRDVARFTLESGKLYLLSSVGGRSVAVMFRGKGRFAFSPPSPIEQQRLARFLKTSALDVPLTEVVFLFADTTLEELRRHVTFAPGDAPGEVRSHAKTALDYLSDDDSRYFEPDLMSAFLNGESSDLFYAHVVRESGDPLMLLLDPHEVEGVRLQMRRPHTGFTRVAEVICRFPRHGASGDPGVHASRVDEATVSHYAIETTLTSHGLGGELGFAARSTVDLASDVPGARWLVFGLFPKAQVDSATWPDGTTAVVFKGKDAPLLWVRLESPLADGETRALRLVYHGDLISRFGDFFFVDPDADWYPRPLDGRSVATFDLTFHSPKAYLLASVGDKTDSSVTDRVVTSRWVTAEPIRNASFNLGIFENYRVTEPDIPAINIMVSEQAHRALAQQFEQQRNMQKAVAGDLTRSLQFFQTTFGRLPIKQLYATEIPWFEGLAYPGRIDLSWVTFQQTDQQGEDEVFRAHEVAHQWWGIGVDFATYHDQWLSEGLADFSGLWYLQTALRSNDKYFGMLHRWREHVLERRDEPSPVWLGYRTASSKDLAGYNVIVYEKGAWVLHMLRILMLDLKTMNEDRFTETMRDFYHTYQGKRASTEDFRRVVEQHVGTDMGWFFDEWVYGSGIPSYRVTWRSSAAGNGQFKVQLHVDQDNVGDDFMMYVPVSLDLGGGQAARLRVKVRGRSSDIDLPIMPAQPKSLKFNDLDGVLAEVKQLD
jgi:hypothetical protein